MVNFVNKSPLFQGGLRGVHKTKFEKNVVPKFKQLGKVIVFGTMLLAVISIITKNMVG